MPPADGKPVEGASGAAAPAAPATPAPPAAPAVGAKPAPPRPGGGGLDFANSDIAFAGTNMWVDPVNDITTIFMMQNNEASPDFRPLHGQWVYGGYKPAVTSGPAETPAQ